MGKQFHFTKTHAIDEAIKLSKKEKLEVVVYLKPGTEEYRFCEYESYALPDDWVLESYCNGERTDFPFYVNS